MQLPKGGLGVANLVEHKVQYGSGANGLAKKNGTTKKVAEEFIRVYYARYKRVAEWQQEVYNAVVASRVVTKFHTPAGYPMGRGEYESLTGRIYVFNEKDPPENFHSRDPNFNPPEIKNYPVQGFATGDVMALFRARMVRRWIAEFSRSLVLMINTVHDSVMFDCATKEEALRVKKMLEEIAATLQDEVFKLWGIVAPVPFKVETSIGPSWAAQEKI